ncbi:DUF385 domain-containing protein [Saccharopolyspora terrae]|uniref:DUF385 domain-containing protein n=1 Tax=Saccharopolyspora terrae TaxID=2530384 RepID=A0A4V2Y9F4_9PSEU|nr:nitroreductase/quinone reductase family protein [Saccharopolyspora terrae]TDC99645.1 DUF385 domain-containing protein [Saccharopolyspora terrae]
MPLTGEYEPSPTEFVRDQVEKYESSGGTEGTTMHGFPVVVLTTKGAKSGKIRKTPVMRVEHDGPQRGDYEARELSGEERELWWDRAVAAFPNYAEYQTKTERTIPVVLLEPVAS